MLMDAQVILHVTHAGDVSDILDAAFVGFVPNPAVEGDLGVADNHLDAAQVELEFVLKSLGDDRPEDLVRRVGAGEFGLGALLILTSHTMVSLLAQSLRKEPVPWPSVPYVAGDRA